MISKENSLELNVEEKQKYEKNDTKNNEHKVSKRDVEKHNEKEPEQKLSLPLRIPAFGIFMMIFSAISYSLGSLIIKLLPHLHSLEVLFFRCCLQFIVNFIIALINGNNLMGASGQRLDLLMRGVYGTVSSMGSFMAFSLISLSDATTIQFSSPVFVTLFAYFILKEPLTILQVLTGTITLAGVVIIAKPKFLFDSQLIVSGNRIPGLLSAIMGAFGNAMAIITLRKLKTTPVSVVVIWYSVAIIVTTLITLIVWKQFRWPMDWQTWALLLAIGVSGVGDQYFMTIALRYETAGPASIARTVTIVLAFIWDVLVLNGKFDWNAAVGASLVSTGVIILGLYKWNKENPQLLKKIKSSFKCSQNKSLKSRNERSIKIDLDEIENIELK